MARATMGLLFQQHLQHDILLFISDHTSSEILIQNVQL